ncbi:MAG: hypothetical protein ACOZEN_08805 [Thermodesulfobacteriota bacterium]
MRTLKDWLMGKCARPEDAPSGADMDDGRATESFSMRPVRMTEPVTLVTTSAQHMDLLKAEGLTDRDKSKIIRAAIALALPTLVANPHMIDLLQPGAVVDHEILAEALSSRRPGSAEPDNMGAK